MINNMMLNESAFRLIFKVPPSKRHLITGASNKNDMPGKPRMYNLEMVLSVMCIDSNIVIGDIKKLTGLSKYCIHKCIKYFLFVGEIKANFLHKSGKYNVYSYRLA